jgi:hypothetical protein
MGKIDVRIEWKDETPWLVSEFEYFVNKGMKTLKLDGTCTVTALPPQEVKDEGCPDHHIKGCKCEYCRDSEKPKPELPEKVNLPVFVHDYFKRGTWTGEELQALNDHIGLLEKAHIQKLAFIIQEARKQCLTDLRARLEGK